MSESCLPLISVVVPAYNPPKELFDKCINSIVGQRGLNLEVLIVDDGSRDEMAAYFDEVEATHPIVKVVHQANGGEGAARNSGLRYAKGKYVVFVDADDGLAPNWLSTALEIAEKRDASIVMGKVLIVGEAPDDPSVRVDCATALYEKDELWQVQRGFLVKGACLVGTLEYLDLGVCSKLIRRDCLEGLFFPIGIKLSSDQVFNHAMLRRAERYVITDADAYYYVENPNSVSHVYNPDAAEIMMRSMALVRENLIDKPEVEQAFYFRVAMEIVTAIQFIAFSDGHPLTFREKLNAVRRAAGEPLATEALDKMDLSKIPDASSRFKVSMLKNRRYALYVCLKQLSKIGKTS